jgi:hypothetical protein
MADELWFVDPTAGGTKVRIPLAARPIDLVGKVVGMIDNTKEQADVILETMAEALIARYGAKDVIIERKEAFSKPATARQLDALAKRVQVAAAAVGG